MRFFSPLFLSVSILLAACNDPATSRLRYINKPYLFSFIPPKDWTVTESQTPTCLASVEARHGDCRFYICVSQPPEEFLPTTSDFANCELVKAYVEEKLKGFNVRSQPSRLQGRRSYDAIYLRNVVEKDGTPLLQLVRQTFLVRGKLLYTLTSYVFGKSEEELKAANAPCDEAILRSQASFFLHKPPKTPTP